MIVEEKKEPFKPQQANPKDLKQKAGKKLPLPFQTGKQYGIFAKAQKGNSSSDEEDDRETEAENRNLKNLPTNFAKKQVLNNRKSSDSNDENHEHQNPPMSEVKDKKSDTSSSEPSDKSED